MKWMCDHVAIAARERRIVAGFNVFGYDDAQAVIRAVEQDPAKADPLEYAQKARAFMREQLGC